MDRNVSKGITNNKSLIYIKNSIKNTIKRVIDIRVNV